MATGFKQTEVGLIPEDWEVYQLNHLGDFKKGKNIPKSSIADNGVPCVIYGEIYTKYNFYSAKIYSYTSIEVAKKSTEIKCGDILFAGSGETAEDIGKCFAYVGKENGFAGGDIIVFTPRKCDSLFLGFLLNSAVVVKQKSIIGQGSSVFHIYPNNLKKMLIPLPPLAEQTAIARVLSDADALIQKLEQLIAKKRNLKTAAMQELLKPKEGWEKKKLGDIADLYQSETISQEKFTIDGYLVYGANGIIGKYDRYNHEHWQTIITCRGSTCGTVNKTVDKCWITGNAMVVNVDGNPNIDKLFFYYLLKRQDFSNCITGSGQPQIVRKPLYEYNIQMPKYISEQTRIAQILSDMDNEIEALEKQLEKYKRLKQGMMQSLLTGKIRLV